MEEAYSACKNRGPITPPDPDTQNGANEEESVNNFDLNDESELIAQQEMRTPSPIDEELELMLQNNENVDKVITEFYKEEKEAEKKLAPSESQPSKWEALANDESELAKSPEQSEKRTKKRRHKDTLMNDSEKTGRKRKYSSSEEKIKLEKLKEMSFGSSRNSGQDTRRFNFRENNTSDRHSASKMDRKETTPLKSMVSSRRDSPDSQSHYRSDSNHPVIKTFRELKTLSLPFALDKLLSFNPQDVAALNKQEMIEVLDIMFELNRRREQLTTNRMRLTDEVRMICNNEIEVLNRLDHLMTPDERNFFNQVLKQCPPSMDEVSPLDPKIEPEDANPSQHATRLHATDLLPDPSTPLTGRHDPNWETLFNHIPPNFRGAPPPPGVLQEFKQQQHYTAPPSQPNLSLPPPNFVAVPHHLSQMPPPLASVNTSMPPSQPVVSVIPTASQSTQPVAITSQPPPVQSSQPAAFQQNVPPPQFSQQNASVVSQPSVVTAPIFSQPPPNSQPLPIMVQQQQPIVYMDQPPPNMMPAEVQQPPIGFQQSEVVQPATDISIVAASNPVSIIHQPPPANIELHPTDQIPVSTNIPITSVPPPNTSIRPAEMTNFPPPSNQPVQLQSNVNASSLAPIDLSVPPPTFSSNLVPMDQPREQLSPVSAFRNSLNSSLLNSLVGARPQFPQQSLVTDLPPPGPSITFLQQPPMSMQGPSGSPQRYVQGMPPPGKSPQGPYPLMSFETKNPFQKQRHGKSPSFRVGNNKDKVVQRRGGRALKQKKQMGDLSMGGQDQAKQSFEEMGAGESPASSISQVTTVGGLSAIVGNESLMDKGDVNAEITGLSSQQQFD